MRARWRSWLTMLAMAEDDNEGTFAVPPVTGSFTRLAPGLGLGTMSYHPSKRTRQAWNTADSALRKILEKDGLSQVKPWAIEVAESVTAHPLGSARIGDNPTTSALTDTHELRGHPGLFITDGSAVPTSLTVNPSLTIAALAERATPTIITRTHSYGVSIQHGAPLPGQ